MEPVNGFDPDETLPLDGDEPQHKIEGSKRLLSLLINHNVDETTSASLLSHLASLREGGWDDTSYELVIKSFRLALIGGMEPTLAKRMLTDGILPMASASPSSRSDGDNSDSTWIGKIVRCVINELLSAAFQDVDSDTTHENMDTTNNASNINEGIKILLPTFLHRMDNDEACQTISSMGDAALEGRDSIDDIIDKFCGYKHYKSYPHVTAGLLSAVKEFDSLTTSSGRISKRRVWQKKSKYGQDYTFEYVDRPTCLVKMAISALDALASSKEPDALPPLVYQLAILPMGLLHDDSKVKVKGENEKQRGMRLRKMVLEGIAVALEDGSLGVSNATESGNAVVVQGSNAKSDEWKWSRYTSLAHMGTCLRMDPEMGKSVLAMLGGEVSAQDSSGSVAPFRYQRLTPFKLAMGLSMASSVPRMRQSALGCVRDLLLEEETIRIRCGLGRDGKRVGLGKPWMLCLVRCLEKASSGDVNAWNDFQLENEDEQIGHVLKCLIMVAKFAESSEAGGSSISAGSASMILQSLITLGFLLIDTVKKDETSNKGDTRASTLLSSTLDPSILTGSAGSSLEDTSATHATACTGRMLLCYLFYQSAAAASHVMMSSLSRGSYEGGTSLCRLILKSSVDKLCGMAPNALEFGKVLTALLQFSPVCLNSITQDLEADCDGLDDRQRGEVISLAMAAHHIPMLIDTLANVPGGGMVPSIATQAIIPAVVNLLHLQASAESLRPGLAGYLWKKNDIIDHVDHAYLLAKKSLFCIDEDKRKCAAKMLVSLIGTAVIASSGGNKRTVSKWAPSLDEMRSSLRRCLTQHQQSVRMEAYSSLMATFPDGTTSSSVSQTQESVSPKSTSSTASHSPKLLSSHTTQPPIPLAAREGLSDMICSILQNQLERYVGTPPEELQDKRARQQRGSAIGSQLSQMVDAEPTQDTESNPLRFEMFISTRSTQADAQGKAKKKKSTPLAQTLLNEALSRINEPLGFLIACCSVASSGTKSGDSDIADDINHQAELRDSVKSLRLRMAACKDIEQYLKWLKSNKNILEITNNAKRKQEMAIGKLSTLISVAVTAEALLGTCGNNHDDGFIVESTNNEEVESLFNLRVDAVTRASEIMSTFVNSNPKKKLKELDANSNTSSKKKTAKRSSGDNDDDSHDGENGLMTTTEINRTVQAKNKKLLEAAINNISPALPLGFLSSSLRKFGAKAEQINDSNQDSDDEEGESAITKRLASCMVFRRFLLTKSALLVGGGLNVVKAGSPFVPLNGNGLIASSLALGQTLFADFCANSYHLDRTSISPNNSSQEMALTQLSLRGFTICVANMASSIAHSMSRVERINVILKCAKMAASNAASSSKESWDYYDKLNVDNLPHENTPVEELTLTKALLPFISHESSSRICLYEELLNQSMHCEAMEIANSILAASSALTDANLREQFGVLLLNCLETRDGDGEKVGVLGLDFGEDASDETRLSSSIDIGFTLSNGLDGDTHAPLPPRFIGQFKGNDEERLRRSRLKVGLPTTKIENWPKRHRDRLREELTLHGGCGMGIVQKVSWALTVKLGSNDEFESTFGPNSPTKKELKLACIKALSTDTPNFNREKVDISHAIVDCIENGLENADFITLKLIPNLSEKSLSLCQRFVACSLLTTSKVICSSAPSADSIDNNGTFASTLLKHAKRLYSVLVKLVLSYSSNPKSISCVETKALLEFMTATLQPRIAALLLVLQGKQQTSEGKYLAESKIESHGRVASQLVFEKEKLDNALLKMGATLKQAGLTEQCEWLGKHVVTSADREFRIRDVEQAKKREAPKQKKTAGSKRKVKEESNKKKKKVKVKKEEEGSEADDSSQEHSEGSDEESEEAAATCEVVDSDMEDAESQDEQDEIEEEMDEDDESDEEAEFDD